MKRTRTAIVVFENVEVLDFCGPFEVFSVTRLNEEHRRQESSPFEVFLVAENERPGRRHRRDEGFAGLRSGRFEKQLHIVEDGTLFTSAGISAGIDMALKVVSRYCGEAVARATAKHMEYPYPDSNARRVAIAQQPAASGVR